jgi:hypothetical protein
MKLKKIHLLLIIAFFSLSNCGNAITPTDPIPKHDTFKIQSTQVNEERVINVWVPDKYLSSNDSLPVMYMADGGIEEDFPHIANTLNKLIKQNKIKPLILVGIENTQRRRDLTGVTSVEEDKKVAPVVGGSEKFRNFIKDELIPEINKRYRTTNDRSIIGESLSGLFVMETFFLTPELFNTYIAFDPSLWWNNHYWVQNASNYLAKMTSTPKRVWFAGSSATDIYVHTRALASIFKTENHANIAWNYSDEPKEKHNTIFRAAKEKAIIWALN